MKRDAGLCHKILDTVIILLMGLAFFNALASENFKVITKYGFIWGVCGLGIMAILRYREKVKQICNYFLAHTKWMILLLIVFGVIQIFVFSSISGTIWSDAGDIYQGVFAEDKTAITNYLSACQNNMPIYVYENLIKDILGLKGINRSTTVVYTVINIINYDIGFLFLSLMMKKMYGKKAGFLTMFACFIVLGLNNQMYQFYTTALSWPATCLGLYLYVSIKMSDVMKKRLILGGIWGMALAWGYLARPSSIIYFIAIIIFEVLHIGKNKEYFVKTGLICVAVLTGFLLLSGVYRIVRQPYELELDPNKHSVMVQFMAYGITGNGSGTKEVRDAIGMAETTEERRQTAIQIWKGELKKLGIVGYPDFLAKKHLRETGDGTYGLLSPHIEENYSSNKILNFLQNIWYSQGRYVDFTAFAMQLVYVLFLLWILIGIRIKTGFSFVLKLSLLGWHAFLLLFEGARTGYTIQSFPVMIPLAVLGMLTVLSDTVLCSDSKKEAQAAVKRNGEEGLEGS